MHNHMLIPFLVKHSFWVAVASYWIFSAAVSSMPAPNGSGNGYKWLYQFLNKLAGNLFNAFGSKVPGEPTPPPTVPPATPQS